MAGLTTTGITIKDLDEILSDLEGAEAANIDANINVEADSVLGQLNGIYAEALSECWELLEEIYQSAYPDTASGQSLSYVAAYTGAIRQEATKTEAYVGVFGTSGMTVPQGTQMYPDGDPDSLFEFTADVIVTGGFVNATMYAVTPGSATTVAVGDAIVIATPVSGLTSVNVVVASDAVTLGADEETDGELRLRREQSLAQAGASTVDAIRADMLTVTGVDTCSVFENTGIATDANGVPGKAIEVLVYSSAAPTYTDQDVADQVWLSKPAGTEAYGNNGPHTVTDSSGDSHTVYFSEPTTVRTYVEVALTKAVDGTYVGDDGVAQALEEWGQRALTVGRDVFASDIVNVVADLTGVVSVFVGAVFVDRDATPSPHTSLAIAPRELATIAKADVDVTSI